MNSSRNRGRLTMLVVGAVLVALAATASISLSAKSSDRPVADLLGGTSGSQGSDESLPSHAIKLAGGRIDRKTTWGVWLHGDTSAGNCWSTETISRGTPFGETYCGYPVPPAYWRLISSGPVGRPGNPRAMLFFLVRHDVGRIAVLVNQGKGRPNKRIEMTTRVISSEQARESRADPNFGYATAIYSGSLFCVKQVELFDRTGSRVRNVRPACTGPRDPVEENFE